MKKIVEGARLRAVNRDSGEVTFLEVTRVLGQRWWARKIRQSEVGYNPRTIFVRQGEYVSQNRKAPVPPRASENSLGAIQR